MIFFFMIPSYLMNLFFAFPGTNPYAWGGSDVVAVEAEAGRRR